jgi:hypothetical protein
MLPKIMQKRTIFQTVEDPKALLGQYEFNGCSNRVRRHERHSGFYAIIGTEVVLTGLFLDNNPGRIAMKLSTIALAGALAMSSTFALAQAGGANGSGATIPENSGTATNAQGGAVGAVSPNGAMQRGTTGQGMGAGGSMGNNNGTAGGPTSLSGTGSSKDGGQKPADTGKH